MFKFYVIFKGLNSNIICSNQDIDTSMYDVGPFDSLNDAKLALIEYCKSQLLFWEMKVDNAENFLLHQCIDMRRDDKE